MTEEFPKKTVTVRIFPDGSVGAETHGIKGQECANYVGVLEEIFEAQTTGAAYTAEYYETEETAPEAAGRDEIDGRDDPRPLPPSAAEPRPPAPEGAP